MRSAGPAGPRPRTSRPASTRSSPSTAAPPAEQEQRRHRARSPACSSRSRATGTTSVTVGSPAPDKAAIKDKVQAFVDQYNSTIDFIRAELTEKRVPNATTDTDARKGSLFGDPQLTGLLSQLRSAICDKTGDRRRDQVARRHRRVDRHRLRRRGERRLGRRQADARRRQARRRARPTNRLDVKSFLTDTTKGIAAKLNGLLDPVAKATTGLIDVRAKQAGDESSDIDDQIQALEARLSQQPGPPPGPVHRDGAGAGAEPVAGLLADARQLGYTQPQLAAGPADHRDSPAPRTDTVTRPMSAYAPAPRPTARAPS